MTDRSRLQNRLELLGTCAMIAVAIAIAHGGESFAQSIPAFQGTPTVASGSAFVSRGGPSGGAAAVDSISLNSQAAIINWDTFDRTTNATIDFLPQNTIGRFQGGQDFVVLNRVFAATPGQAISLNGTVQSQDFSGQRTGSVWFYSPGGIIAGPTSVFNVGNLILTADDIDTTNGLFGPNSTIRFRGGTGSTSAVTIQPGAQINLTAPGSYLALVAPQVTMGGTATINGSAAYIAAEQVDVRINGGAFDIAFVTGTGVANALIHSGTTTGPAAANGTIAMAAMPKNTAITMLVGGTVGYTPAATATVQNGTIVLSAGQDIVSGGIGATPSTAPANLTIGSGTFRSQVGAQATNIVASPNGGGPLSFTRNANLTGLTSAEVRADAGETVALGGNLTLISQRPGVGGTARLIGDGAGSQIFGSGPIVIDASAFGTPSFVGVGGNAVGGTAEFRVTGETATFSSVSVLANGTGGTGLTQSGSGTGGTAQIVAQPGGANPAFTASSTVTVSASGIGAGPGQVLNQRGGNGVGGAASFTFAAGTGFVEGSINVIANGTGGAGNIAGGDASGGTARLSVSSSNLDAASINIFANAEAGTTNDGGTSGNGNPTGLAEITVNNAVLSTRSGLGLNIGASSSTSLFAPGISGTPAVAGTVEGGRARLAFTNSAVSTSLASTLVTANGEASGATVSGGSGTGGTAELIMSGGTFQTNILDMGARGGSVFGSGSRIGIGLGGQAVLTMTNFATLTASSVELAAWAAGTSVGNPAPARGGAIDITLSDSTVTSSIIADANGDGGFNTAGTTAGLGTGGTIDLLMEGASSALSFDLRADGGTLGEQRGGFAEGIAPVHTGGRITAALSGGNVSEGIRLSARGVGFISDGQANGGAASLTISGATVEGDTISVLATGTGGDGIVGDAEVGRLATRGGNGTGGTALFDFVSGNLVTPSVTVDASGSGGSGGDGGSTNAAAGGNGIGGTATFRNLAGSTLDTLAINVSAQGLGGVGGISRLTIGSAGVSFNGGNGGSGTGGTALIDWRGVALPQSFTPPTLSAIASGEGEDGGAGYDTAPGQSGRFGGQGGDGTGGTARLLISGATTSFNNVLADAHATGGDAAIGNATRRGGDATGGIAEVRVTDAALAAGIININSFANAGDSAAGRFGSGPRGADATGGSSLFEVAGANGTYVSRVGSPSAYSGTPIFSLASDAYATNGISGSNGTTGGAGGRGGNATGGQVMVRVTDGLIDLGSPTIVGTYVDAVGGNAGNGGNASIYQPTGGGAGGDGGTGTGGSITFTANGGRLFFGDLSLSSGAIAGSAGFGGFDAGVAAIPGTPASPGVPAIPGTPAIPPAFGGFGSQSFGNGGTITIESLPGSISGNDSRVTGGDVSANVVASTIGYGDFGYAGSVSVSNLNTGGTALQLGSLTVDAGPPAISFFSGSTTITANSSPIAVDGDIRVTGPTNAYVQTSGTGFVTAGGNVDLNVQGSIGIDQFGTGGQPALKATSITAVAGYDINIQSALISADNDIALSSAFASITTGALTTGRDIGVTADNGNVLLGPITAGRSAVIYGSPTTSAVTVGTVIVGGFLEARGATLDFGNITAGTDAILSTFNGELTVGNVTAGDDIFLTVNGSAANPNTISPDSQTGAGGATAFALVAGNIRSTGLGSDTAASGPATFTGAGPTGNVVRIRASGAVQTGSVTTPGNAILSSDSRSVVAGAITATAGIGIFARTDATLGNATTNGAFWLGNSSQYFLNVPTYQVTNFPFSQSPTDGNATLGTVAAGLIRGTTTGAMTFDNLTATSDILWRTGNSTIIGGNISGNRVSAGASLTLVAGQSVSFTDATAQGSVLVVGSTGSVTGTSLRSTGDTVDADGRTGVIIGTVTTPARATLGASGGDVRVATNLATGDVIAGGLNVFLRSSGTIAASALQATAGNIDVSASNGLSVIDAQATGNVIFSTNGTARLDAVSSGLDTNVTARDIQVRVGVLGGRALRFDAQGGISVDGNFNSPVIELRSGDINIGGEYRVGTIGVTRQISLTSTASTPTFVGGANNSGGYSLSGAEMTRLSAENISIIASPQTQVQNSTGQSPLALTPNVAPDLILDTFTITGGQNLGANGTLLIRTPGKMRTVGQVILDGMTVGNRLDLRAVTAIEALPASSITIRNTGGLTGTLAMTAENIIASSSAALADVAAATTLTTASDRLGANNATPSDDGYFQAGGITVTVSKGIYVQNTGSSTTPANSDFATRRGFTVGATGFTVVQASSAPVRVAINGRQLSATTGTTGTPSTSGFATGVDVAPLIQFVPFGQQSGTPFTFPATGATAAQQQQATALFDPLSTVNGCAIITSGSCGNAVVVNDPIRDILAGDFGEDAVGNLLPVAIVQLKDYSQAGDEPLIDEPVTGAGNDDLWSVDDSTTCDPAKEACK